MIRVLVVDDSAIARELIVQILAVDPDIEVVGEAENGRQAIKMTEELRPHVITMDIHMPDLDGFQATKEIMIKRPTPIIIVSGSASVQEIDTAVRAMQVGALTVRMKPAGPHSAGFESDARDLVETVKLMSEVRVIKHHRRDTTGGGLPSSRIPKPNPNLEVVAIAASTGGPLALQCLLENLPADFPLPILIVQHIADGFVEGFVDWLNHVSPLSVKVAEDSEPMAAGHVYVAPQDQHLGVVASGKVRLSSDAPVEGFRPSGTHLFHSVASACRERTVAIILTGMGSDGVAGLRSVREQGGLIVAQDEDTCVVFGMPGVAIEEGLPHQVLPIGAIPRYLIELVGRRDR